MIKILIVLGIILIFFIWSAFIVSGRCSRIEEQINIDKENGKEEVNCKEI